ncbi:MAG: formate dehydrogenase accessory sulfurtransferase FdhD [Alphaproteobacteria bacterium]|nr:formate dehydrogenase accessory sulfurtransferase FdhD [Alphaproteobacteria bacterium]
MARPPSVEAGAQVLRGDGTLAIAERIAEELPVALVYNNVVVAVMMATPADLEDFAWGFSLGEAIVDDPDDIIAVTLRSGATGAEIHVTVEPEAASRAGARTRKLVGRSGCGLCGLGSLEAAVVAARPVGDALRLRPQAVAAALAQLPDFQPLNRETRAVHAAAWADRDGAIVMAREDVGRHNALDKLVGAMARARIRPDQGFCVVTSRCSYEMVEKAMRAGIEVLVAVSAPTGLALRLAEQAGMTVVGIARADAQTVFTHPQRLGLAP